MNTKIKHFSFSSLGFGAMAGILLAFTFLYFVVFGNYVLYFQETQSLFLFTADYLKSFLSRPGGILEYTGRFITQFYYDRITGSVIIAVIITIPCLILWSIVKKAEKNSFLLTGLAFIPSFLLLVMQSNYYHLVDNNLGIIAVILLYRIYTGIKESTRDFITLAAFPVIYYLAGAYSFLLVLQLVTHNLSYGPRRKKYLTPLLIILCSFIVFLISWKIVFNLPWQQLILSPLPLLKHPAYILTFSLLAGYVAIFPLLFSLFSKRERPIFNSPVFGTLFAFVLFAVSVFFLFRIYNPQTSRIVEMERLVFAGDWKEAADYHERKPSRNLISEYFYNLALAESDQLCDRIFMSSQDFGTGALVLPWGDDHLNRGAYFYYAIGLFNEAHRWAYEEMVVHGLRPQNLDLLIKTSIINGDYRMAVKYNRLLKRTFFYRSRAFEYDELIEDPSLIASHPEFSEKKKLIPAEDFFIQFNEPQNNLPLLLKIQSGNRKAFEYYMAGHLLTKNIEAAVGYVPLMAKEGFSRIPRYIEEALLIYNNSTGKMPDLGGLAISYESQARFNGYFNAYVAARTSPSTMKERMEKDFGDTYWFYFHFR